MKTIKINSSSEIPENFTGIAEYPNGAKNWYKNGKQYREDGPAIEYPDGSKFWYKEGKRHREDGPACEFSDGGCWWYLEDKEYYPNNLNDYIILDHYKGKHNLMWYRLLDEDNIFEYPDIPGLIEK